MADLFSVFSFGFDLLFSEKHFLIFSSYPTFYLFVNLFRGSLFFITAILCYTHIFVHVLTHICVHI